MVKSPYFNRHSQLIQLLVYTPTIDPIKDVEKKAWVDGPILRVTAQTSNGNSPGSGEVVGIGQDTPSRRLVIRYYGKEQVSYMDRVRINGETFTIDGEPTVSTSMTNQVMTTFYVSKQGANT